MISCGESRSVAIPPCAHHPFSQTTKRLFQTKPRPGLLATVLPAASPSGCWQEARHVTCRGRCASRRRPSMLRFAVVQTSVARFEEYLFF